MKLIKYTGTLSVLSLPGQSYTESANFPLVGCILLLFLYHIVLDDLSVFWKYYNHHCSNPDSNEPNYRMPFLVSTPPLKIEKYTPESNRMGWPQTPEKTNQVLRWFPNRFHEMQAWQQWCCSFHQFPSFCKNQQLLAVHHPCYHPLATFWIHCIQAMKPMNLYRYQLVRIYLARTHLNIT